MPESQLRASLCRLSRAGRIHPVFFGSAITGAGVSELMTALPALLPSAHDAVGSAPSARVFKIDHPGGARRTYVRVFAGSLRPRSVLAVAGAEGKITGLSGFAGSRAVSRDSLRAGEIGLSTG